MKLLITGSKGFLGGFLLKKLKSSSDLTHYEIAEFEGDLLKPADLNRYFDEKSKWDCVIHLAAISSVPMCEAQPDLAHQTNTVATSLICEAIKKFTPQAKFIFASTGQVYDLLKDLDQPVDECHAVNPMNTYAKTKRAAELHIEQCFKSFGGSYSILRIFNHSHKTQNPEFFMPSIYKQIMAKKDKENPVTLEVGNMDVVRDIGAVQDIIEALYQIIRTNKKDQEIYNLCSGTGKSLRKIVIEMSKLLNIQVNLKIIAERVRADDPALMVASCQKLEKKYNWHPKYAKMESDLVRSFLIDISDGPIMKDRKIFVAGKTGMVGSAIIRALRAQGYTNITAPSSKELDLTNQAQVEAFFNTEKPEYVYVAAAKVGGIYANNTFPGDFIYSNLCIQNNIIHSSYRYGVKKLLFLGSSCIYPKLTQQPIKEEYLLTGPLEPTNEAYAIAKIAGVKMCEFYNRQYGTNFITAMPTNLYGPGDNYNLLNAHVLPALMRKFHEAKVESKNEVPIWGTGQPLREFMHVDDLADACLFLMNNYTGAEHINVGSGQEVSIAELAGIIKDVVKFDGDISFDLTKPNGSPRKLMDSSRLHQLGWSPKISLLDGIKQTYKEFANSTDYRDQ